MPDYIVTSKTGGRMRYHARMAVPVSARERLGVKSLSRLLEAQTYDAALKESIPHIEAFRRTIAEATKDPEERPLRTVRFHIRVADDPEAQDFFVNGLERFLKEIDPTFDMNGFEIRRTQVHKRGKKA